MFSYRNPSMLYGPVAQWDERYAPVPGWGVNPLYAGPPRVGIGADAPSCPLAWGPLIVAFVVGAAGTMLYLQQTKAKSAVVGV